MFWVNLVCGEVPLHNDQYRGRCLVNSLSLGTKDSPPGRPIGRGDPEVGAGHAAVTGYITDGL